MAVIVAPVPQHHGKEMNTTKVVYCCPLCGFEIEQPSKYEKAEVEEVPDHCKIKMEIVRSLSCSICGYKASEVLSLINEKINL